MAAKTGVPVRKFSVTHYTIVTLLQALLIQSAATSSAKSADLLTLPGSTAPADIAAALPGFLPAIAAAVRSRSDNSAAIVRDKVKRCRRTDDDSLLAIAVEEYLLFHQSAGDIHLAEEAVWMLVWLRTRAASLPVEPSHFSALIDVLNCREKFSSLGVLLHWLFHRIEMRYGESSLEFFRALQQLLEVQFWAKDIKEVDMLATHLGRLRDKYMPSPPALCFCNNWNMYPLDHEHYLAKAVESCMVLVLKKEWSAALVRLQKAAADLNRARKDLTKLHAAALIDAQNAGIGGADASREEAIEKELQARVEQIDVYLCTANMLSAQACVAYSGKESLPSVQQQQWFASSYNLARDSLGANARITLSIRFSHAQWLMDRRMFPHAATIYQDIAVKMISTYSALSFIHDVRLVLALRSLSRCFMHFYDVKSSIAVIDVAIELNVRLFGHDDPRTMQLVVDKSDVILSKTLLTTSDLELVESDLTRVHSSFVSILDKIRHDAEVEREARSFDPNKADRPAVYLSKAELEAKRREARGIMFTNPPVPPHIESAVEAQTNSAPRVNGKLKAVATLADAWCDIVLFSSAAANDVFLNFAVQTIDVSIRSDMKAFQYMCNNGLARACRMLGLYFIKKLHLSVHVNRSDRGEASKTSVKLAMQYLRQYMSLLNENHSFDTPPGVVLGLQSLARIVYSNAAVLGGAVEASKGADTALKVCVRCLVRFESEGDKSLALDIQRTQTMAMNVRNGVSIMEGLTTDDFPRRCSGPNCSNTEASLNQFHIRLGGGDLRFCSRECLESWNLFTSTKNWFDDLSNKLILRILRFSHEVPHWAVVAQTCRRMWGLVSAHRTRLVLPRHDALTTDSLSNLANNSPQARVFHLSRVTSATDDNLRLIAQRCPLTHTFVLQRSPFVSDFGAAALAEGCSHLRYLDLSGCFLLTDEFLWSLAHGCLHLMFLLLASCSEISAGGLVVVAQRCLQLIELDLSYCRKVTDSAMCAVRENSSRLCCLSIQGCAAITDSEVRRLGLKFPFVLSPMGEILGSNPSAHQSPAWPPVVERVEYAPRYEGSPALAAADAAAALGDRVRTSYSGATQRRE